MCKISLKWNHFILLILSELFYYLMKLFYSTYIFFYFKQQIEAKHTKFELFFTPGKYVKLQMSFRKNHLCRFKYAKLNLDI